MTLNILPGQTICLGWQTENAVEAVVFDKPEWLAAYGPGTFELVHKRRQDTEALPVAVDVSGGTVTWNIEAGDVLYRGRGEAQLRYFGTDGKIKCSEIYETQVQRSLVSDSDVPEPMQGWVEQVLAAAAGIQNMQAAAQTNQPGTPATVVKTVDPETGVVTLTFGIPQGVQGETGRGIASVSVTQTGEWIVTYTDGTSVTVGHDVYSAIEALADAAEQSAERAEQAANTAGYIDVEIVDGDLIYKRTDAVDVDFELIDGDLVMEVI